MRKAFQPRDLANSLEGSAKALHHLAIAYDSGHRSSLVIEAAALIEQTAVMFRKAEKPNASVVPTAPLPDLALSVKSTQTAAAPAPSLFWRPVAPAQRGLQPPVKTSPVAPVTAPGPTSFWREKRAAALKATG